MVKDPSSLILPDMRIVQFHFIVMIITWSLLLTVESAQIDGMALVEQYYDHAPLLALYNTSAYSKAKCFLELGNIAQQG